MLFRKVVELVNAKKHLKVDNLQEFVSIRAVLNKGLSDYEISKFNVKPVNIVKPVISAVKTFNPY